jgi:hypothetical protein
VDVECRTYRNIVLGGLLPLPIVKLCITESGIVILSQLAKIAFLRTYRILECDYNEAIECLTWNKGSGRYRRNGSAIACVDHKLPKAENNAAGSARLEKHPNGLFLILFAAATTAGWLVRKRVRKVCILGFLIFPLSLLSLCSILRGQRFVSGVG